MGASGRNKNCASDLRVFVHDFRQRSQAFGLVGKRAFDGFEVVSCDSDGNGGDNCTPVTRQQNESDGCDIANDAGGPTNFDNYEEAHKDEIRNGKECALALDCNMGSITTVRLREAGGWRVREG